MDFHQKVYHARVFVEYLKIHTNQFPPTLCDVMISRFGINPFIILSACLISLRARDRVTTPICLKLFENAQTPEQFLTISVFDLEKTLFSVGFYASKAKTLHEVARVLVSKHGGVVPRDPLELRALPGWA